MTRCRTRVVEKILDLLDTVANVILVILIAILAGLLFAHAFIGCTKQPVEAPTCESPTEAQIQKGVTWVAVHGPGSSCQWNEGSCSFDCEEGEGWDD